MSSTHTRFWLVVLPAALVSLALFGVATAGPVNTPNVFQPNTPALASEVNGNFAAHESAIDDNDSRITNNSARLAAIEQGNIDGIVRGAASIAADGTVDRSFNLRGGTVTVIKNSIGVYRVTFGGFTDMNSRFYSTTIGGTDGGGERGSASVAPFLIDLASSLFVQTLDESGALADLPFYIVVY